MSRVVRVYLPATIDDLAALVSSGELPVRALAHAVTAAVRADDPEADLDDWEFQAFCDAAASSLSLLDSSVPARRVVVSADVDEDQVLDAPRTDSADLPLSAVQVVGAVSVSAVAAVHVDGREAEVAVAATLDGAGTSVLDDVALEWYAPDEVARLLE